MKKVSAIAVDAVPVIFDDRCLKEIARDGNCQQRQIFPALHGACGEPCAIMLSQSACPLPTICITR